jgi:Glucose/sorbosone dehydrogenases
MNPVLTLAFVGLALITVATSCSHDDPQSPSYVIETIPMPADLEAETGGLAFLPDGRLAACFTRGEVMIYDPAQRNWEVFAKGLHEPLGLWVVNARELLVMQRPELTRLVDTDGDGEADLYEKVADDFGLSGNYHEFNYGPVKDKNGNLFIALNTASYGGKIQPNTRGVVNTLGRDGADGRRQMFSAVPYRGWVMKQTPQGALEPYASGFRSPNGIGIDPDGNLFVTDNQSDWVETSTLYHVKEGHFYGHPASLVWKEGWNRGSPFDLPIEELDHMRTQASVYFPHGIIANSPAQPVWDTTDGKFGPFAGQLFVGEMNHKRIVRVMLEKVKGEFQGACIPFLDNQGLPIGNNRLAFAPDGSLWIGQIAHGWSGDKGIRRVTFTGKQPMDIYRMSLTTKGFDLSFTRPLDAATALNKDHYRIRHYYYAYRKKPFDEPIDHSQQSNIQQIGIKRLHLSPDGRTVSMELDSLKAGYVYELELHNVKSKDGMPAENQTICYTLNNLLE